LKSTPHPSPPETSDRPRGERGKGSRFSSFSKPEFDSVFQVAVFLKKLTVSPLSLWERARVREAF